MIICIDFDETLFPTLNNVVKIYNRRHGEILSLDQIVTYNLYECLDPIVADELLELFVDKTVYDCLQPFKGAIRAVQTLINQGHEIYIATATNVKNLEWKEQLLRRYFPFVPSENLIRIHNKKLLNCDVIVDDNLDTLIKSFAERVCFNQPWNQSESKTFAYDIHRFNHWGEFGNIISDIERKNKEWEK